MNWSVMVPRVQDRLLQRWLRIAPCPGCLLRRGDAMHVCDEMLPLSMFSRLLGWLLELMSSIPRKRAAIPIDSTAEEESPPRKNTCSLVSSAARGADGRFVCRPRPPSRELSSAQRAAIDHVKALAKASSAMALSTLRARLRDAGLKDIDAHDLLAFVRNRAPVIVHVPYCVLDLLVEDTHLRNQFETNRSRGTLSHASRVIWERALFGGAYDGPGSLPFDRVKYGVLALNGEGFGVPSASRYGDCYLKLRASVRERVTVTRSDSGQVHSQVYLHPSQCAIGTLDDFAHIASSMSARELAGLAAAAAAANGGRLPGVTPCPAALYGAICGAIYDHDYKEVQIHGELLLAEDVEELVIRASDKRLKAKVAQSFSDKHGVAVRWWSGGAP